ncbi:alpha-tocopherol transfer protein-like [Chironomus tepperi]|uniref:alpha-tocopherol transfer protein-like n=1 Tax=Chironomus tepperi TaxID=113505 RepID=UPI00391FB111
MSNGTADNDIRAKQSLELFKNWLAKHPFLKYTGEDSIDDLLMFYLRVKKFSMQKAYESFEFTIPFMISHPDWYANPGPADYEFTHKPNSPLIFLKKLDSEGRRIYVYKMKNFDNFDSIKYFRQHFLTPLLFFADLPAQENGIVAVMDYTDVNLKKFTKVPIQVIYDTLQLSKFGLLRLKQLNLIGMPSFLKPFIEIAKTFTTAKILQRFNFINNIKELPKYMDVSLLPKEYGGSSKELLDFEVFELGTYYVNQMYKFDVNFSKIQQYENVGSFRKLEID